MSKTANLKENVKGVLSQKVRLGFFSLPLWAVGAYFVVRQLRSRRRGPAYS